MGTSTRRNKAVVNRGDTRFELDLDEAQAKALADAELRKAQVGGGDSASQTAELPPSWAPGSDPAEEFDRAMGVAGSAGTECEVWLLGDNNQETALVKAGLSIDEVKPGALQTAYGGGKFRVKLIVDGLVIRSRDIPIGGPPKESIRMLLPNNGNGGNGNAAPLPADSNIAMLVAMQDANMKMMAMAAEQRRHEESMQLERRRIDAEQEREVRKQEAEARRAEADKVNQLFQLMVTHTLGKSSDGSAEALKSVLSFMGDMAHVIAKETNREGALSWVQTLLPHVEAYMTSRAAAKAATMPALPPANNMQSGQGVERPSSPLGASAEGGADVSPSAGPTSVTALELMRTIQAEIFPRMLRAATESIYDSEEEEFAPWDPRMFYEMIVFELRVHPADLRQLFKTYVGGVSEFAAMLPENQRAAVESHRPWFAKFFEIVLEAEEEEKEDKIGQPSTLDGAAGADVHQSIPRA